MEINTGCYIDGAVPREAWQVCYKLKHMIQDFGGILTEDLLTDVAKACDSFTRPCNEDILYLQDDLLDVLNATLQPKLSALWDGGDLLVVDDSWFQEQHI